MSGKIIGIDLGTTNSLVSVWKDGSIQLIPNSFGEYLTPSVVSFDNDGTVHVGKVAKEMLITNPQSTFYEFKRNMGTDYRYHVGDREYRAEELSSFVLRQLKADAEKFLGEEVEEAIVSVPAYFNDDKRFATKNAGALAGLKVDRIINEPSAVALKHHMESNDMERFIIFDFGGGTLDVSLVDAFDNMVEIQAVAGDNYLGGKDFNEMIAGHFYKKYNIFSEFLTDEEKGIVNKEAELLKIDLSKSNSASRKLLIQGKEYVMELTNQELIHITSNLFKRMIKPVHKVLNDSSSGWEDIDKVILVGGSSKMPVVRKYLQSSCDTRVVLDDRPDESIGIGVGLAAAIKMRTGEIKDMILSDICPFSLGIEIVGDKFSPIIERNETLPCSRTRMYTTVYNNQKKVDINIYQGENLTASENLNIGNLQIDVPGAPAGVPQIFVTFMYDINGILDIRVDNSGKSVHKIIVNKNMKMSKSELDARIKELQDMTLHPEELETNRLLIERAKRLYRECNPQHRPQLVSMLEHFQNVIAHGRMMDIRKEYVKFTFYLNFIEQNKFNDNDTDFDESFWSDEDIYEDSQDYDEEE